MILSAWPSKICFWAPPKELASSSLTVYIQDKSFYLYKDKSFYLYDVGLGLTPTQQIITVMLLIPEMLLDSFDHGHWIAMFYEFCRLISNVGFSIFRVSYITQIQSKIFQVSDIYKTHPKSRFRFQFSDIFQVWIGFEYDKKMYLDLDLDLDYAKSDRIWHDCHPIQREKILDSAEEDLYNKLAEYRDSHWTSSLKAKTHISPSSWHQYWHEPLKYRFVRFSTPTTRYVCINPSRFFLQLQAHSAQGQGSNYP